MFRKLNNDAILRFHGVFCESPRSSRAYSCYRKSGHSNNNDNIASLDEHILLKFWNQCHSFERQNIIKKQNNIMWTIRIAKFCTKVARFGDLERNVLDHEFILYVCMHIELTRTFILDKAVDALSLDLDGNYTEQTDNETNTSTFYCACNYITTYITRWRRISRESMRLQDI